MEEPETDDAIRYSRKELLPLTIQLYTEYRTMQNLYLTSDESIVLTSQNVVIDGIRHEAVLTSRRLIVVRLDDPKASHQAIPLAAIRSAIAGENTLHEPTITLSLASPDGVLNTVQLVFIRLASEHRNNQYDEWVARLKEHVSVSTAEPAGPTSPPGTPGTADHPGTPRVPSYVFHPPKPVSPPPESGIAKIAIAVIVIAALLIAVFAGSQLLSANPAGGTQPAVPPGAAAPPSTTGAPPVPTPSPALTVQPSATPAPAPEVLVPSSGIWVRVQYPGTFTGYIGTRGSMRQVNSTGDRFYQIPTTGGVIEGEIRKSESTGDELAVTVYKDGTLIKRINTTVPAGTLYLNIPV